MSADLWIAATLRNDTELAEMLSGGVHFDIAPKGTAAPYADLSLASSLPTESAYADCVFDNELWRVKVVDHDISWERAASIAEKIREVLHHASADSNGVVGCRYRQSRRFSEDDGGNTFRYIVLDFEIYTQS